MKTTQKETAESIRSFNRFYLPYFHLLTQRYLNSDYSAAEARILYEIYDDPGIIARDIAGRLRVDKGYLSRILKKFEAKGLIIRKNALEDGRQASITLTKAGESLVRELIQYSNQEIEGLIAGCSNDELKKLSEHMTRIIDILDNKAEE